MAITYADRTGDSDYKQRSVINFGNSGFYTETAIEVVQFMWTVKVTHTQYQFNLRRDGVAFTLFNSVKQFEIKLNWNMNTQCKTTKADNCCLFL